MREAAVLVPLVEQAGAVSILFAVRSTRISQGGEVSFPGGHLLPGELPEQAAVRESAEELLMDASGIELLCPLHILSRGAGDRVYAYLGILRGAYSFQKDEVERLVTVPFSYFLENEPKAYGASTVTCPDDDFPFHLVKGGRAYPFFRSRKIYYFYEVDGEVIWGLTAAFLYHMSRLFKEE